jgi:replication factor C small subunit
MEHAIWTEKYRPKDFSEVLGQDAVVSRVKAFVESKNMPHLLFAGPAGVGKTSLALVIAKQMFGGSWHNNFLELNASDERGIDIIRNKVKDFARTRAIGDVPFKIIYLDECDALTREAQQALRRTMENYTQTCRFVLAANYSSKIIDPIQSRCAIFRFKPITDETIYSLASVARPKEIKEVLELALKNKFIDAREKLLDVMLNYGLSGLDVIRQVQRELYNIELDGRKKMSLIDKCGEAEFRMTEGSDEFIQLEAFLANVTLVGSKD